MAKAKFDYFDSFIKQTEVALEEAELLKRTINEYGENCEMHDILTEAHAIEHRGDTLAHEVIDNVAIDFITPFERDDILVLTQCLDNITDNIEDVIQSFYMFDVHQMREEALEFTEIILKGIKTLNSAAQEFKNYKKSTSIRQLIIQVNDCEEEGDRLFQRAMRTLYTVERDVPMRVHVWNQLYTRLEKTTDSCEHAADVMGSVILKNS